MEPATTRTTQQPSLEDRVARMERLLALLVATVQECVDELFEVGDPGV